jgi:hypothetical protein
MHTSTAERRAYLIFLSIYRSPYEPNMTNFSCLGMEGFHEPPVPPGYISDYIIENV